MGLNSAPQIAILASGRGSNFDAIVKAIGEGTLNARISLVASDREEAPVIAKAQSLGIQTVIEKNQERLAEFLVGQKLDYVVLAGYMRILKENFIQSFWDDRGFARIVNIHPSLLPQFPGRDGYRQAFEAKETLAGVTVHFVDLGVDTGPICAQQEFGIGDCKSVEEVEARGLAIEHELYPKTLNWILKNDFEIKTREGRPHVQPH
ncbi:MAG: phosphoribosylglycinamide formyltransferase [Bdellovibrionaceae bacterium]|nr:phosphoribosylglycinamide formyltransferase [Pseudobdellovibrionaceae bacterium]